ncbi:1-deoxy-D-xylulose-5-phosphate reductoisomerase [candidate division NPL-UPA2 bacterium Unc8]|uniref:1-deoxy-D-xylulose 5-phosphate reductoisomerase n=1 Tax=candidate division NPL-UPA2 bacterium Unc8 TaxID=1980939 RepID=A0A399FY42_UNCN2|nr:1-deoxy-D-xylulose 5-phosphate reductoisomerase [Bacillota bacterium]MBT9146404.1 1-deoxy-D-xylulose 5-phosphate reductoisomerase [Bacillota bacterium]RII00113.1 MAG: 1-deoxy-D-xylulose-5-phosphate reductoisomerase [candidate division NPL-UPA2 bacterium Unc8]
MKKIGILGSTGSIGSTALGVIDSLGKKFSLFALAGGNNVTAMEGQIRKFHPQLVAMADSVAARELKKRTSGIKIFEGDEGIIKIAECPEIDIVIIAIAGAKSLLPTLSAVRTGKVVALASKEAVVMAGKLLLEEAGRHGSQILPLDSEANALFQCLNGENIDKVRKVILTASGGPFYGLPFKGLSSISPQEALRHPTWKMGQRITIDSATMMNKALEIIEIVNLFGIDASKIEVVIHPQAKVHSVVDFIDGTMIALLGATDMSLPIQHCLTYPERVASEIPAVDLVESSPLEFMRPDMSRFPSLKYGYEAASAGGTLPTVLNGADEEAVDAFLSHRIGFLEIAAVVERVMKKHNLIESPDIEEILAADRTSRLEARKCFGA